MTEEYNPQIAAPNDLDLERTLLAAVIADNAVLDRLQGFEPEMLFDPIHASIFAAMGDLRGEKRPINLVTLKPRFGAVPFATGGTVFEYMQTFSFAGNMPTITDVSDALKELHLRREVQSLCERGAGAVWDQGYGPNTVLTDLIQQASLLLDKAKPVAITRRRMKDALHDMMDKMLNDDTASRIPSGFSDLDAATGGWRRGEYVLLAGRPSMGKSTAAVAFAKQAAKSGVGVAVFSLEMTNQQWVTRTVCDEVWDHRAPIHYSEAIKGNLTDEQLERYSRGVINLEKLPLVVDVRGGMSAAEIAMATRQISEDLAKDGISLGMIVVDHLGKVRPTSRYKGNPVREVAEISEAMANLAKSEDVCVLALHQLNRGVEGRDNKRPGLSDLRDSGSLEQDADMVLFPYRPAYYLERAKEDDTEKDFERRHQLQTLKNVLELGIAKQRNGPTTTLNFFVDIAANAIRDAAKVDASAPVYSGQR
jgi:replicative DNA helicase